MTSISRIPYIWKWSCYLSLSCLLCSSAYLFGMLKCHISEKNRRWSWRSGRRWRGASLKFSSQSLSQLIGRRSNKLISSTVPPFRFTDRSRVTPYTCVTCLPFWLLPCWHYADRGRVNIGHHAWTSLQASFSLIDCTPAFALYLASWPEEKKVRNQPENLLLISQNPLLFYRSERNCWCLAQPLVRKGADHPGIPAEGLCGISEQAA